MSRPRIVVLGLMSRMPVAGVVWQTLHYLLGFERLGYETCYVEAHGRVPQMLMRSPRDDGNRLAAAFIADVLADWGLGDRWALHDPHTGVELGADRATRRGWLASAELVVNLHGGTIPLDEHRSGGPLLLLETDPVQLEVELHRRDPAAVAFVDAHDAWATFGESIGHEGCGVPVEPERRPYATRQPVLLDLWTTERDPDPSDSHFTTIASWKQPDREIWLGDRRYGWTKHDQFRRVLDLPARTGASFELALSRIDDHERDLLGRHGWRVSDALALSNDTARYRDFVQRSGAEFTVAKEQNVALRSGWFSDRSATYLAAGRPVVTQDTGFGAHLPLGPGLVAWSDGGEAAEAIARIRADRRAATDHARSVAAECFAAEHVLSALLAPLGVVAPPRHHGSATVPDPLDRVPLGVVSRHPLVVEPELGDIVDALPLRPGPPVSAPDASIVIPTHANRTLLHLCLAALLRGPEHGPTFEILVVDDASNDGTAELLTHVARSGGQVVAVRNQERLGFAASVNRGIGAARGHAIVILNDDTVPPPGWLGPLLTHLRDSTVGAVGPRTNRSGTSAEVAVGYRDVAGLRREAAARRTARAGLRHDAPTLAMFCCALRRQVVERIGPLDEAFGIGLFEDDDYAQRIHLAGLRTVIADDVLVHHFGEATLGQHHHDGVRHAQFAANRDRFEEKWQRRWQPDRPGVETRATRIEAIAELVAALDGRVRAAIVSRGDEALLQRIGPSARHFPMTDDGAWTPGVPVDDDELIAGLRRARRAGATHLVVPDDAQWWWRHYRVLASSAPAAHTSAGRAFALTDLGVDA